MILAVDFDGVIVKDGGGVYRAPLELVPGAWEGLAALKRAGHVIIVFSARANRALRDDWRLNPLWVEEPSGWEEDRRTASLAYQQMLNYVADELADLVDAVDDGRQGKLVADMFVDDRALNFGPGGFDWADVARFLGAEP